MVRIRLRRIGFRNQHSYRIVAADKEKPRDGRFLELLGFYNPRTEPATITIEEERVFDWLSKGAQPSDSVSQIFKVTGLMDRYKQLKEGAKLEDVLAEAKKFYDSREIDPKTRRDAKPKKEKES